jgi:hypothetical protein
VQNSSIIIDDETTATQNNVAIRNNDSQTNSALVLSPKGTGAFILGPKPDGLFSGGNARGNYAIDLQVRKSTGTQIASGADSFLSGYQSTASGSVAICLGSQSLASGIRSVSLGANNNSTAQEAITLGGSRGLADRLAMQAHAAGRFSAQGDAQRARFVMRGKTTTNAAVELFLDGSTTRLTIPSGKVLGLTINITGIKSDGSAVAHYLRQYCLKHVSATTSEVYAPVTIGTDNPAGTSIALSADDPNNALKVEVTGIAAETWRWVAAVDAVEIAFGT